MFAVTLAVCTFAPPKDPPKVVAQSTVPLSGGSAVIRNDRDLGLNNLSSAPAAKIKTRLASTLKVDGIDWDKHTVVCVSGGKQEKAGMSIELKALEVKGGKLVVHWKYNETGGKPDGFYPELVLLLERFDGEIVIDPAPTAQNDK